MDIDRSSIVLLNALRKSNIDKSEYIKKHNMSKGNFGRMVKKLRGLGFDIRCEKVVNVYSYKLLEEYIDTSVIEDEKLRKKIEKIKCVNEYHTKKTYQIVGEKVEITIDNSKTIISEDKTLLVYLLLQEGRGITEIANILGKKRSSFYNYKAKLDLFNRVEFTEKEIEILKRCGMYRQVTRF